jgi:hypothetical protein
MSIRLRTVEGIRVALCGVESDPLDGDVYLDDRDHYALAMKFWKDWNEDFKHPRIDDPPLQWAVMETQKVRDAQEEMEKWCQERENGLVK